MTSHQKLIVTLICVLLVAIGIAFAYFVPFTAPSAQQPPFGDISLGMLSSDAVKLVGREGKPYDHDKLPTIPLPRQLNKGIPASATWFVWWNEKTGIAELTLGVLEGRVIYKGVMWMEDGQVKGVVRTLPEYQK